jgi:hypothetical protein
MEVPVPAEAQPFNRIEYRIDIFLLLFFGIGVVKTQVTYTVIITGKAKVEADAFGMADVQVAIRFGRKTGFHTSIPLARPVIFFDDITDEVGSGYRGGHGCGVIFQIGLSHVIH